MSKAQDIINDMGYMQETLLAIIREGEHFLTHRGIVMILEDAGEFDSVQDWYDEICKAESWDTLWSWVMGQLEGYCDIKGEE